MTFPRTLFKGRRYGVYGLGRNGLPVARRLFSLGAAVLAWDDDEAARVDAGVPLRELRSAEGLDALVLSPGIPHAGSRAPEVATDAIRRGIPILSDAMLLQDAVRRSGSLAKFVGVTGTNGKSTTTALVRHLLAANGIDAVAGGNLGPAALALPLLGDDGVYVIEMSSYMLERVPGLRFDAGVMLNLSPDHLDRHGDMDHYIEAKRQIFANQEAHDLAVIGLDDAPSRSLAAAIPRAVGISGEDRAGATWRVDARGMLRAGSVPVADLGRARALPGVHNRQNAAAAAAIAAHLGVPPSAIASSLLDFEGLAHRQKPVATIDGITFVDDSKATNADAAARALAASPRCVWIAGGEAKEGGIESLASRLAIVAEALLIGRDAAILAGTLARERVPHRIVGTLERAVREAFEAARARGVSTVLLSPACASFDQFRDFEERGLRFASLAEALADRVSPEDHAA